MSNKTSAKDCMEQAQAFASAWSLVGKAGFGTTLEQAMAEKTKLQAMLYLLAFTGAEEDAFYKWLSEKCPSGDHAEVQRKWLASSDYADLFVR